MENLTVKSRVSDRSEKLNIWWIGKGLKQYWRWPLWGALLGLIVSTLLFYAIPPKYAASVVISPARVGSLMMTSSGASVVQGSEPEPAALMIERLRQPSFYSEEMRQACQVAQSLDYQKEMAKDLKANIVKLPNSMNQNLSLARLHWSASSPKIAFACLDTIVNSLRESQNLIVFPVIQKLTEQKKITQDQLNLYLSELSKIERKFSGKDNTQNNFNQIVIAEKAAQNLRESLATIRKQLAEEEAQLSEPFTQAVKQLEPIYSSGEPIITFKMAALIGVLVGICLGYFALLVALSYQRFRSENTGYKSTN